MKALPSIAYSGFKGTASEVTARQVGGRTLLNGRAQHSHVKTPKQSIRRGNFSFITKQYKTLSDEQLAAWSALASSHSEKALVGDGTTLTPHNLFVCLNTNRSLLGVSITKNAPDNIHGSLPVVYDDIWITPERLLITGLEEPSLSNYRLVIKLASSDSAGVNSAWGKSVLVGNFSTTDWGDVDATGVYGKEFGIPITVGHKYFIEMYWIDENSGYISEVTRISSVAVDSESIKGNEYAPRVTLSLDSIEESATHEYNGFDCELSSGSIIMSCDIDIKLTSGVGGSFYLNFNDIPDEFRGTRNFMLGRGDKDSNHPYSITLSEMYVSPYASTKNVSLANRGGPFSRHQYIFGSFFTF